jgi:DNA-binding CsgD family transcriptional regulator
MTGKEIRKSILEAGIRLWQCADKLGCAEATFSKKLRHDFSKEDTEKILSIIEELKAEKEQKK